MAERACPLSQFSRPRTAGVCVSGPRQTTISPPLHATRFPRALVSTNSTRTGVRSPRYRISPDCRRTGFLSARRLATRSSWASTQLSFRRRNPDTSLPLAPTGCTTSTPPGPTRMRVCQGGPGDDHVVIHEAAAQHYPLVRYGLHSSDTPSDLANSSPAAPSKSQFSGTPSRRSLNSDLRARSKPVTNTAAFLNGDASPEPL